MPFLIRIIAQRAITAMIGLLTFLGLAPEATIPTPAEVEVRIEEQRQIVDSVLKAKEGVENIVDSLDRAATNLNQARQNLENGPTQQTNQTENQSPTIKTTKPSATTTKPAQSPAIDQILVDRSSPEPETSQGETMGSLADVVVNIICTQQKDGLTTASTGSGVLISSKGVVLTNAHVAQFFLLEDGGYPINCAIYRENIPTFGYKADILYISPRWVRENYKAITAQSPRGTGERDYALLYITENTNPVLSLPKTFAYSKFNLDSSIYTDGRRISVAGFPGAPASIFDLAKAGSLKTDVTEITEVFTFSNGSGVDIFSTGRTSVAAKGASGGGIFYNNDLIGITVTTSPEGSGSKINALSTLYIDSDINKELGDRVNSLLSGNIKEKVANFKSENAAELSKLLAGQL